MKITRSTINTDSQVIQKHIHGVERWYGTDGDNTMSVANNITPWTLTAATTANVYGPAVTLSTVSDVKDADMGITVAKFDVGKIAVTKASAVDKMHMIQIWNGATQFGSATLSTEIPYRTAATSGEIGPIDLKMARITVSNRLWARQKCATTSTTLDVLIGVHAYP